VRIPLLGRVAAGTPILAEQNFEGFVNLTEYFAPSGETFALRVRGDSMIEAGIFDGDVVIVRSQPTVQNGEIAVVVIDGEATVKRLYEEPDAWRLEPANAALQSIRVPKSEPAFRIAGKVVGVLRKL
jgi:repressor LexA